LGWNTCARAVEKAFGVGRSEACHQNRQDLVGFEPKRIDPYLSESVSFAKWPTTFASRSSYGTSVRKRGDVELKAKWQAQDHP
jgi:hypothetical protein